MLKVTQLIGFAVRQAAEEEEAEFLLDAYPSALFACSLRQLITGATVAVRIRRSSDSTESDFGFDGNGDFDAAAAATFIGGGSGFIVTWYDQSGSGYVVTQATAANQPAYSAAGLVSLPTVSFDGGDSLVDLSADFGAVSNATVMSVMQQTGTDAQGGLFYRDNNAAGSLIGTLATYDDVLYFDLGLLDGAGRINVGQPGGWDDTPHILELYRDSGDNQAIVVDGSSLVSASRTADISAGSGRFVIGGFADGSLLFTGFCSELVIWGTDLGSTDRTGARNNINNYYSVF